jgi:crotonobetainyl-CoA:carnitine CoA-transferase CaiB-like acyl-CoA transferase
VSGPFDGVRVVDLTSMISGPVATMLLGDQGADVIKVEPPGGDLVRHMGAHRNGFSATFLSANRSKRSLVLDLKQAAGREVLTRLIATADVFVQNFRPGAIERMGFGEETVRAINDRVVYVSISGFGERGPYAHKRVYDPVIQALSGLAAIQQDRESGRPRMVRTIIPDKTTALAAAQAIAAALFARERTGRGQHVRLAMLDTMIAYLWPEGLAGHTFVGARPAAARAQLAADLIFETTDGYITAGAVSDAEWRGLCRALERPEWLEDARFQTAQGRVVNVAARLELMAGVLRQRPAAEWLARLDAEGVPCAPVLETGAVFSQEQARINGIVIESEHPQAGPIRQPRPAARFEGTPALPGRPAPVLGGQTRALLAELGFDRAGIERLFATGAAAGPGEDEA